VFREPSVPARRLAEYLAAPEGGAAKPWSPRPTGRLRAPVSRRWAGGHVSVYVNSRLAAVTLACASERELAIDLDPARIVPAGASVRGCFRDSLTLVPLRGRLVLERGEGSTLKRELDASGAFLLDDLEPGSARLIAHFDDRGIWRRDVELGSSSRIELGTIDLPRASTVRGRLVRPDAGIAAFPVLLEPIEEPDASSRNLDRAPARADARLTYAEEGRPLPVRARDSRRYLLLRVPPSDEGFPCPTPGGLRERCALEIGSAGLFEEHEVHLAPTRKVILRAACPWRAPCPIGSSIRRARVSEAGRLREARLLTRGSSREGMLWCSRSGEHARRRVASRFPRAGAIELVFEPPIAEQEHPHGTRTRAFLSCAGGAAGGAVPGRVRNRALPHPRVGYSFC
jgi:hypothetical protein